MEKLTVRRRMGVGGRDLGVPGLLSHFPPKVGARQNDFGQKMLVIAAKSSGDHSHLAGKDLYCWKSVFFFLLQLKGNMHGYWSVLCCVIPFYTYSTYVPVIF